MKKWILLSVLVLAMVLTVGCERKITNEAQTAIDNEGAALGCFECHGDGDTPKRGIVQQFANSIHASGDHTYLNRLDDHESCERCHTSEGFVAYVTGVPADGDHFTSFDCFTCHEPHTNGDFRLRVQTAYVLENGVVFDRGHANTCATCHHSRRDVSDYVYAGVTTSSHWGPHHSNQADMLIGENAYEFTGYDYENSWHQSGVTDGCPQCHMSAPAHESIGGHSWNMENDDLELENISGCNVAGCHQTDPVESLNRMTDEDFDDDGVPEGVQTELHDLHNELGELLMAAGYIDEEGDPITVTISDADSAGALYDYLFIKEDRSFGVHNTDYAVGLMKSSINYLETGDPNGVKSGAPFAMRSSH